MAADLPDGEDREPFGLTRRSVLVAGSLLGAALALGIDLTACTSSSAKHAAPPVLSPHELDVVTEATARLIPGPTDDPSEAGHPGAREAGVANYIAAMLGAFAHEPPLVYAGGPFSNRAGSKTDDMATFVELPDTIRQQWKQRLDELAMRYHHGVTALDAGAGGNFAAAPVAARDAALTKNPGGFTDLLFQHSIEGCYAVPEYLANAKLVGWHEIAFPGDSQPRGWPDAKVTNSDGPDPLEPEGIVEKVLDLLESTSPASSKKPDIVGPHRQGAAG